MIQTATGVGGTDNYVDSYGCDGETATGGAGTCGFACNAACLWSLYANPTVKSWM